MQKVCEQNRVTTEVSDTQRPHDKLTVCFNISIKITDFAHPLFRELGRISLKQALNWDTKYAQTIAVLRIGMTTQCWPLTPLLRESPWTPIQLDFIICWSVFQWVKYSCLNFTFARTEVRRPVQNYTNALSEESQQTLLLLWRKQLMLHQTEQDAP